jgi:hypothetical protein
MAKKSTRKADHSAAAGANGSGDGSRRGEKSEAIRQYFKTHKHAMPKEVVASLKEKGLTVSPNMVSMIKAKLGIKRVKRSARLAAEANHASAGTEARHAAGLDAALTLYKAAREQSDVPASKIRQSFLALVEILG